MSRETNFNITICYILKKTSQESKATKRGLFSII